MVLQHQSLRLRPATAEDAPQLAAWWNDGSVMAHAGYPLGLGTTPEQVAKELQGGSDERGRRLIIELHGVPIGETNYGAEGNGAAWLGIKICDASQQNHGHGRIALSLLISYLFGTLGFQRLHLDTNLNNPRAQHVYETLGFCRVRVNRDAWRDQLGNPQSMVDYELVPANFNSFCQTLP